MYKIKKIFINSITAIFISLFIIELFKYLKTDNNIFGVYYLITNLVIIFFLVPIAYNYKRYYSVARISKIIIVILIGLFSSFALEHIVSSIYSYTDDSTTYIKNIFIIKNVLKTVIYVLLTGFTVLEFKSEKVINKKDITNKLDFF